MLWTVLPLSVEQGIVGSLVGSPMIGLAAEETYLRAALFLVALIIGTLVFSAKAISSKSKTGQKTFILYGEESRKKAIEFSPDRFDQLIGINYSPMICTVTCLSRARV